MYEHSGTPSDTINLILDVVFVAAAEERAF
jgi:hypothetical protein